MSSLVRLCVRVFGYFKFEARVLLPFLLCLSRAKNAFIRGLFMFCWGFSVRSAECSWSLSACYRVESLEPLLGMVIVAFSAFFAGSFFVFLVLGLFWTGDGGNRKIVADGSSESNSYYKALGIRLIAEEPRGRL